MLKSKISLIIVLFLTISLAADDGIIIRKNQRTLEQINSIYSQMDPVRYSPPPYRWKNLPRTRKLLADRGTLRVVMLGDSIVNDTSRSCWNLLIEKSYPECKIEKITSVRGSTGCWWYKEPGRVKKFVLDHKPDLVMIGGISHRGDIDSIRDVIRPKNQRPQSFQRISQRARTACPQDRRSFPRHGSGLGRVHSQISQRPFFKRDSIHANERGEQILGRILESYFTLPDIEAKAD